MNRRQLLFLVAFSGLFFSCYSKKESADHSYGSDLKVSTDSRNPNADTALIRTHLLALTQTKSFRTYYNTSQLDETADYIRKNVEPYADSVYFQTFSVQGRVYKNVIASFGPMRAPRIVIGAHYDVCGEQQGADDNASGVTGILELARLLKGKNLSYRIDLVAYSLEEPPYFRTRDMGSYVHAKSLFDSGAAVFGMISLEMIGYFSDEPGSQRYPEGVPADLFGDTGDYIALIARKVGGPFEKQFCSTFKSSASIKSAVLAAPPSMPGVDFSDHLNYWALGFDAVMITDTSFYRNKNYHRSSDTPGTLDVRKMAQVIDGILRALSRM